MGRRRTADPPSSGSNPDTRSKFSDDSECESDYIAKSGKALAQGKSRRFESGLVTSFLSLFFWANADATTW